MDDKIIKVNNDQHAKSQVFDDVMPFFRLKNA